MSDADIARLNKDVPMTRVRSRAGLPRWLDVKPPLTPDFVVKDPNAAPVWEVTGFEFTESKNHTADKISIRFPRLTRERTDKTPAEATSLHELQALKKASAPSALAGVHADDFGSAFQRNLTAAGAAAAAAAAQRRVEMKQVEEAEAAAAARAPKKGTLEALFATSSSPDSRVAGRGGGKPAPKSAGAAASPPRDVRGATSSSGAACDEESGHVAQMALDSTAPATPPRPTTAATSTSASPGSARGRSMLAASQVALERAERERNEERKAVAGLPANGSREARMSSPPRIRPRGGRGAASSSFLVLDDSSEDQYPLSEERGRSSIRARSRARERGSTTTHGGDTGGGEEESDATDDFELEIGAAAGAGHSGDAASDDDGVVIPAARSRKKSRAGNSTRSSRATDRSMHSSPAAHTGPAAAKPASTS